MRDVPFIVAIDFDGVIAEYEGYEGPDHYLPPKPNASAGIDVLRSHGIKVIIWTCRHKESDLREYFAKYNIGYDAINCDVHPEIKGYPADISRKVLADVYLDDRGVRFTDWNSAVEMILQIMTEGVL